MLITGVQILPSVLACLCRCFFIQCKAREENLWFEARAASHSIVEISLVKSAIAINRLTEIKWYKILLSSENTEIPDIEWQLISVINLPICCMREQVVFNSNLWSAGNLHLDMFILLLNKEQWCCKILCNMVTYYIFWIFPPLAEWH